MRSTPPVTAIPMIAPESMPPLDDCVGSTDGVGLTSANEVAAFRRTAYKDGTLSLSAILGVAFLRTSVKSDTEPQ